MWLTFGDSQMGLSCLENPHKNGGVPFGFLKSKNKGVPQPRTHPNGPKTGTLTKPPVIAGNYWQLVSGSLNRGHWMSLHGMSPLEGPLLGDGSNKHSKGNNKCRGFQMINTKTNPFVSKIPFIPIRTPIQMRMVTDVPSCKSQSKGNQGYKPLTSRTESIRFEHSGSAPSAQ